MSDLEAKLKDKYVEDFVNWVKQDLYKMIKPEEIKGSGCGCGCDVEGSGKPPRKPAAVVAAIIGNNRTKFNVKRMKTVSKDAVKISKPTQVKNLIKKVIEERDFPYEQGLYKNPSYKNKSQSTIRRHYLENSPQKRERLGKQMDYDRKKAKDKKNKKDQKDKKD